MKNTVKKHNFTKDEVLTAIENSGGSIKLIAKRLGCAWDTARSYINKYPEAKEQIYQGRLNMVDKAENVLDKAMGDYKKEPKIAVDAAKHVTSTLGSSRGWTKETIIRSVHDFENLPDLTKWTADQFKALVQGANGPATDKENLVFESIKKRKAGTKEQSNGTGNGQKKNK